ncbi:MAG: peptidoglycan hydrolase-like protein with peptidoglycan-binding domain, partial [Myxococcota bacterium]
MSASPLPTYIEVTMSKKRAAKAPGKTATEEAGAAQAGPEASTDNSFMASMLGAKDQQELQDEKAATTLAYKVVRQMQADGGSLRQADPRSGYIPPALAAAFNAVTGQDLTDVPMWTAGVGQEAEELGAVAFARDEEVHMPTESWKPTDTTFELTLAEEFAHVLLNHVPVGGPARQNHARVSEIGFMKRGSSGAGVRELQNALVNAGFMSSSDMATGPGIFGRRTHSAVVAFQAANGLGVDGIVGPATRGKLLSVLLGMHDTGEVRTESAHGNSSFTFSGRPAVRQGDEGVVVKSLQRLLVSKGARLTIDGDFGRKTDNALRSFQAANNLKVDGIAGPVTAASLANASSKNIPAIAAGQGVADPTAGVDVDVDDGDPRRILSDSRISPKMRTVAIATLKDLQSQGLRPYVISGYRSFELQDEIYKQGRTKPGNKVTWVKGGGSWHNYGLAVDIAFWDRSHRTVTWDAPNEDWTAIGEAGLRNGFTRWLGPQGDRPHLEYHPKAGNSASRMR